MTAVAPAARTQTTPRPYKDFLTPALHRRFTNAAFLTLAVCWAEATLMSSKGWLWSCMPIGLTGLRTLLLFIPALAIFIVRVMNMHVGKRNTTSGIETCLHVLVGDGGNQSMIRNLATVGWYLFSACFFGEAYIWSRSAEAGLGWVDMGYTYERPRVNENPLLLRSIFAVLAVAQAVLHLLRDYDRVPIEEALSEQQLLLGEAQRAATPGKKLTAQLPHVAGRVVKLAFPGLVFALVLYFTFLRHTVWDKLAYPIASALVRQIPPNNGPTGVRNLSALARQAFASSALLVSLWEMSNAIFTVHVAQTPLKKGQPLTSEIKDVRGVIISKSRDPNGSFIRGLKAKKDVPRTYAFWELYIITTSFPDRRKTIFAEVDRKDGSTWKQVCQCCLSQLTGITARIQNANQPIEHQKKSAEAGTQSQRGDYLIAQQQQQYGLPKIAQQRVYDDRQVVQKPAGGNARALGDLARSMGSRPDGKNPAVHYTREAIEYGIAHTGGKEAWTRDGLQSTYRKWAAKLFKSPVGDPFRQTFARRVEAAIFGVPYSGKVNIIHASRALSGLAVVSLKEDNYGQVAKDIPNIIRTYTVILTTISNFIASLPPHWSDVDFTEAERNFEIKTVTDNETSIGSNKKMEDVKEVVTVLKDDLEAILLAFGEYAGALGLTKKELREAREAIGN